MKYTIKHTTKFEKDLKMVKKRNYDIGLLTEIIERLANGEELPKKYHDHKLKGNLSHLRECHIQPDWLLMYEIFEGDLILYLTRTGTHSDLFSQK